METFNYKDAASIGVLKNDIISLIHLESKSFFKIHDAVGLRYPFQLRDFTQSQHESFRK